MENYEDIDIKRILEIIFSKKIFIILILLLSINTRLCLFILL